MCGICGIYSPVTRPDARLVQRMMGALSHRGPDGSGYFRDDSVALGHTRLAIIDTAGGAQPMCNEDAARLGHLQRRDLQLRRARRAQLRRLGHTSSPRTATPRSSSTPGRSGASSASPASTASGPSPCGIRATAGAVSRSARASARSTTRGRRPAALRVRDQGAVRRSGVSREFDPVGLDQIFTYWSPVAPRTPFAGASAAAAPGHYLSIETARDARPVLDADFPERARPSPGQDLDENAEGLRERLIEATQAAVRAQRRPGGRLPVRRSRLVGHRGRSSRHSRTRRSTPSRCGSPTRSSTRAPTSADGRATRHQAPRGHGLASATSPRSSPRSSGTPSSRSCGPRRPRCSCCRGWSRESGYKVVVTGEGADEVLGGYDIFREAKVRHFWGRNPGSATRARAVELLYPWMAAVPEPGAGLRASFFGRNLDLDDPGLSHRPRWNSTAGAQGMLTAHESRSSRRRRCGRRTGGFACRPAAPRWDPLGRAQWLEMTTLLPGYILASQGDRMLMANSVEGRFPVPGPEVVAFANALPARHKLSASTRSTCSSGPSPTWCRPRSGTGPSSPTGRPDAASFFCGRDAGLGRRRDVERRPWHCGRLRPRQSCAGLLARQGPPHERIASEQHRQHAAGGGTLHPTAAPQFIARTPARHAAAREPDGRHRPVTERGAR